MKHYKTYGGAAGLVVQTALLFLRYSKLFLTLRRLMATTGLSKGSCNLLPGSISILSTSIIRVNQALTFFTSDQNNNLKVYKNNISLQRRNPAILCTYTKSLPRKIYKKKYFLRSIERRSVHTFSAGEFQLIFCCCCFCFKTVVPFTAM